MSTQKKLETTERNEQSRRFVEKAQELGCDNDEAAFKDRLKKLMSAPPPPSVQQRKPPASKVKKTDKSS
jgi:hypothetical protein